jgi:hypothetical protein
MRRGVIAEYADEATLLAAIGTARAHGFTRLETYTPYQVRALDEALGAPRSPLAIAAGIGGITGAAGGYFLQWLLVAYLYPIDAGGRPPHMPLPFVIITIEMGFLLGALAVFIAFFAASRIFKLWDPVFDVPGFESATRAGFWLAIGADDRRWNRDAAERALLEAGPHRVHGFGGES